MAFYDVWSLEDTMRDTVWWYGVLGVEGETARVWEIRGRTCYAELRLLDSILNKIANKNRHDISCDVFLSWYPKGLYLHPVVFTEGIVLSQASLNRRDAQSKVESFRVAAGKRGSQAESILII